MLNIRFDGLNDPVTNVKIITIMTSIYHHFWPISFWPHCLVSITNPQELAHPNPIPCQYNIRWPTHGLVCVIKLNNNNGLLILMMAWAVDSRAVTSSWSSCRLSGESGGGEDLYKNKLVKNTWSLEQYFYVIELVLSVVLNFFDCIFDAWCCLLTTPDITVIFLCRILAIIGLTNDSFERSCNNHGACGKWVENGTVVSMHCVQAWRRGQYYNYLEVYVVA